MSYDATNTFDAPPALATAGCVYLAHYDLTKVAPDTLTIDQSFKISKVFNRFSPGTFDLTVTPGNTALTSVNAPSYLSCQVGSQGGMVTGNYYQTGIATASGVGPTADNATSFTIVDVFTLNRSYGNRAQDYGAISTLGPINSAVRSGNIKSTVDPIYLTSGAVGTNADLQASNNLNGTTSLRDQTVCLIKRAIPSGGAVVGGQAVGTVKSWVNGVAAATAPTTYTAPAGVARPAIGGQTVGPPGCNPGTLLYHTMLVIQGAVSDADIATLTAWVKAKFFNQLGVARTPLYSTSSGQSNSAYCHQNAGYSYYHESAIMRQLFGNPTMTEVGAEEAYPNSPDFSGTPLLISNYFWTDSTHTNTTAQAQGLSFVDDISTPGTLTLSTGDGAGFQGYYSAAPMQGLFCWPWIQGEADTQALFTTTTYNWNVAGQPQAADTLTQRLNRYQQGLHFLFGSVKTFTGNAACKFALQHTWVVDNNLQAAQQAYRKAVGGFLTNGNIFHYLAPASVSPHYDDPSRYKINAERGRAKAWQMKQAGASPPGNAPGPSYGQFPAITTVTAVAGNKYVDVTFSNPNSATTLKNLVAAGQSAWEVRAGTVTTALAFGAYEFGGTARTLDTAVLPALQSPFVVRVYCTSSNVSGEKLTVFYARQYVAAWFGAMLTDDASTACAPEPLLDIKNFPFYRADAPVANEYCGVSTTVA